MVGNAAPLEARYSIPKLLGWLFIAGSGLALSVYAVMLVLGSGATLTLLAALVGAGFFGFASAAFIRSLFDRREQVRIDARGLTVRAHSDATIPLRSLTGVANRGNRLIFGLSKPARYPATTPWRRFLLRINGDEAGAYFGDLWIWPALLDRSKRDILNAIHDLRAPSEFELEMRALGAPAKNDIVPFRL